MEPPDPLPFRRRRNFRGASIMAITAFCPECHALWAWLYPAQLRLCKCPARKHPLAPARRAHPRWRGREVPEYQVGSFDVRRELYCRRAAG